jgi:hypothetical protein
VANSIAISFVVSLEASKVPGQGDIRAEMQPTQLVQVVWHRLEEHQRPQPQSMQ